MSDVALSEIVKKYLHQSGYTQNELADVLGLNSGVLSRKLNGKGKAYLTHQELHRLITQLAEWRAIATREEVFTLLDAAKVEPAIFSEDDWERPPLGILTWKNTAPVSLRDPLPASYVLQHNLPTPTTRLIGREWAVERLQQLLGSDDIRLVTLVGTGGSGKTRLALHVASGLVDAFAQGVWFVPLAGQRDPALVPINIMQALHIQSTPGTPPLESLIAYLKDRQLLLLLDNFEQVGDAAPDADALLAEVPGLKMLVTSRKTLRLSGEHKFSVPPLDIPDPFRVSEPGALSQYGAVQLFLERAQAIDHDFAMTADNAVSIAQICSKLDGLPLALELAAARINVLPPALLLERISKARLPMLTRGAKNLPDRQRTLGTTIAWSYNLLSSDEQMWFRRLAIFAGGWSLEAAEAIMQGAPGSIAPLDMLEQLVDNSLLVRVPVEHGRVRFTMLETLREYALELLTREGEETQWRDWHACFYLGKAEAGERGLRGAQQLAWLARIEEDRDNFRAALEWSLHRAREGECIDAVSCFPADPVRDRIAIPGSRTFNSKGVAADGIPAIEPCLRMSAALRPYWEWQGYLAEARYWLEAALDVPSGDGAGETTLAARAKALSEASRLSCLQMDQGRAVELAEESITLWRQLDDPSGMATALLHRGWAAHTQGDFETAKRVYSEGLDYLARAEDTWLRAQLLFYLGAAAGFTYHFDQMREYYTQSMQLFEQVGDTSAVADVLKDHGGLSLMQGDCIAAIRYLLKSLKLCYELGHRQYMATGLSLISLAFGMSQKPDPETACLRSATMQGAADGLMEAIGINPFTRENPHARMVRQLIRDQVDEQKYVAALAEGRALTVKQAIELAHELAEDVLAE